MSGVGFSDDNLCVPKQIETPHHERGESMAQDDEKRSALLMSIDASPLDRLIGANLKSLRERAALTPAELSDAVDVSEEEILAYEAGVRRLGAVKMYAFCQILDAKAEDFFRGAGI